MFIRIFKPADLLLPRLKLFVQAAARFLVAAFCEHGRICESKQRSGCCVFERSGAVAINSF